jgi:uncharacterized protein involved in exopolysaccharide biosynthesis
MVCLITLSAGLAAVAASFFITPVYRAETKILPPQMRSMNLFPQGLVGNGYSLDLMKTATAVNAAGYVYIGMLQSRTILDRIIDRFELMDVYGSRYREDARKILASSLHAVSGKYGMISVIVEDRNPIMAADMANAFIDELRQLTQSLAVTEASRRRLFFEQELKQAREKLLLAENLMIAFQEKTGAIKIAEQAEALIESYSLLKAKIASKEVDLKVMKTYATPQNPDLQKAEEELKGMKEQLYLLEERGGRNPDPLVPSGRMPSVETEYFRKLRNLKYYESLLELIGKQYEMARMDEASESLLIQVLDKAIPPEKAVKPDRLLMIGTVLGAGFILAVIMVFLVEYAALMRHT